MTWRLPILSLCIAITSLLSAGIVNAGTDNFEYSPLAYFSAGHPQTAKLHSSQNFYSDNTEDEHDSFIAVAFVYSVSLSHYLYFNDQAQIFTLGVGSVIHKRFIRFRSILV